MRVDLGQLDERDLAVLAFERHQIYLSRGAKEIAVLDTFGLTLTAYYQVLNRLIDDPRALAHDPQTVRRLQRARAVRRRDRSAGHGRRSVSPR